MARVIFINRFYWPEEPATSQLLTDLAQSAAASGFPVSVITSRRGGDSPRHETHRDVKILRVGFARHDRRTPVFRMLDFASFMFAALWRLWREVRGGDTVVILTDPPLFGALAAPLLDWRDARVIHWVQDIYPEVAIALTGQRWLRLLQPWRNHTWRRADHCVTLGSDMAAVLLQAGVASDRLNVIPNWAPEGLAEAPEADCARVKTDWGVAGKFIVLYSGNLGLVHDLMPVLRVAEALKDNPAIALVFVGHGGQHDALRRAAHERGLSNITFQPPQPRTRLGAALSAGDLHWVTLKPGCESCVMPSKLHGILAVARPVLFIGPKSSALFRQIEAENLGLSFTRDQTTEAAAAILALKNDPARRAAMAAQARAHHGATGFATSRDAWLNLLGRAPAPRQ
ncbi:MAG: glycosyltransferase family 4 protein [Opitutaceae bacterium]|nr:glycosyltransferase family 4 protein [Opitutaceae bacterium]